MIGRSGERGSGISMLTARHDDDDYDFEFVIGLILFGLVTCLLNKNSSGTI